MAAKVFGSFISLGWYCATASSMGKHGLRSYAYPFDWVSTKDALGGVIYHIETGFSDFLLKENLEQISVTTFRDAKYNFMFPHDIKTDLDNDYSRIYDKYQRRVERFKCSIKKPTCFIRAVSSDNEAEYILNNFDYINYVIKRSNTDNEIIFLVLSGRKTIIGAHCYTLYIHEWKNDRNSLRGIFDSRADFLMYCKNHIEENAFVRNLEFDRYKQSLVVEDIKLKG